MADPVGMSLGAVSLCIQLVDGIAKGYQYYLSAVGMPASCMKLRAKLGMEYQRLLSWTEAAGLLEYAEGQDIPEILQTNKLVLVDVLTQIRGLIDEFAELNGKYKELRQIRDDDLNEAKRQIDIVGDFSNIFDRELKIEKKRKYLRGTNHIMRGVGNVQDLAKHPRRLIWVSFEESVFVNLLADLTRYNDYLFNLLQGHRAKSLVETTRNTFLEIVAMRNSIEQLKLLVDATRMCPNPTLGYVKITSHMDTNDILRSLAEFRAANVANSSPYSVTGEISRYSELLKKPDLDPEDIQYKNNVTESLSSNISERPLATLARCGIKHNVWIEWKPYSLEIGDGDQTEEQVPRKEDLRRTQELVALLQMEKPAGFCVPQCLGYFDGGIDAASDEPSQRFGLAFEMPSWSRGTSPVQSLLHLTSTASETHSEGPGLEERVAIASRLAMCLQYLHAVQWLHKGIRSDNILFFADQEGKYDFNKPLISGFDFARPDRDGATYTGTVGIHEEVWDVYRHPDYQGTAGQGHFRKTFDIYSLGIVLLEIAFWKPVQDILGFDAGAELTTDQKLGIRDRILDPNGNVYGQLKTRVGAKYAASVLSCVKGLSAFGIEEKEDQMDANVGVRLQRAFIDRVTAPLSNVFQN